VKKTLFTLNVDDYAPEIRELTYPLLKEYAYKIGAEFFEITERKNPSMPPVYEKMQIYDLGREMKNDWNIFIDADALIHPDFPDITTQLNKDTVCFHGKDFAPIRWRYNNYLLRDGRHIGGCNWFAIASDWCLDLWHPLEVPFEEAVENIFPIAGELRTGITREHLIDDYLTSQNIARYGLKHTTVMQMFPPEMKITPNLIFHEYIATIDEKVVLFEKVLQKWGIKCGG